MQFAVEHGAVEGRTVVRVVGELDLATAPELVAALEAALAAGPAQLVVDLTPTTFLDSTGCRVLARSARAGAAAGVAVLVACPPGNTTVRRVLDFLQLDALVPVVSSPDQTA